MGFKAQGIQVNLNLFQSSYNWFPAHIIPQLTWNFETKFTLASYMCYINSLLVTHDSLCNTF